MSFAQLKMKKVIGQEGGEALITGNFLGSVQEV